MTKDLLQELDLSKEPYLIVGVSTGPDSMALLHYLMTNTNIPLVVAHINHNVRKQSQEEEQYLKKYCQDNNLILEIMKIDNYTTNNFENEARTKRYIFYEKILHKYKSHYLFLAHHGDDLIETILMKIVRGSNLEGYAGIKKISQVKDYYIVRPFLDYTKDDLIKYNNDNNIKYYIDISNKDTTYTRNRYRKYLLPFLKKEDINVHQKFQKYSNTLLEYNNYINYEVNNLLPTLYINNALDIDKLQNLHPFLIKNIIYKILTNIYNNQSNIIKEKHLIDIINIINSQKPNLSLNLPHNIKVIKEYNKLYFKANTNNKEDYKIEFKNYLKINNHIFKKIDKTNNNGNNICRLNSKNIKLPLYIRNKKDGDYIEVLGLNGKRKIKDIFIDKKIPSSIRTTYPLLVDANDTILWIPNLKKSKFNLKKEENYDIIIEYCEEEENYE
jgi:tRNA(Ile)-lysidine synthase